MQKEKHKEKMNENEILKYFNKISQLKNKKFSTFDERNLNNFSHFLLFFPPLFFFLTLPNMPSSCCKFKSSGTKSTFATVDICNFQWYQTKKKAKSLSIRLDLYAFFF